MASGKEYKMMFLLNATMGSSYNSTFSGAQQKIASLGREIQSMQNLQGKIDSYQKQQAAIQATKDKISILQSQYDNLQSEMRETGDSSAELQNKMLAKQLQIDRSTQSLGRQEEKLDTMGQALQSAGVSTENLARESSVLSTKISALQKEQERAAETAETFGQSFTSTMEAAQSVLVASGIADGLKAIYDAYKDCVDISIQFGETMSAVQAIANANNDDMAALTEKAKELGASTKFTATESAEAMTYMAMAGWKTSDMLEGMDSVMNLAAASGEDLATTSDIVTDNLTAFGLSAKDTGRFADVLAAAATNSNTNVSIMGETFKNAAAVAGALNYSIEDVAVAVGLMANAGIKGSNAGTALRNIFTGLLDGVTLTSDAFGEYEYSVLNSDGTTKSFSQTIDELRTYFDQMTGAEKTMNAQNIAGQRAFAGFLSILNASDADVEKLTASINGSSGAAERMAKIRLNNLAGDITLMESAADGLKMTIGEALNPEMRSATQFLTEMITNVNDAATAYPGLTRGIEAFVGVVGLATAGIAAYTTATKIATAISTAFNAATGVALGPVMAIVGGLGLLAGAVAMFTTEADDGIPKMEELTANATALNEVMEESTTTFEQTETDLVSTAGVAERYIDALEAMGDYTSLNTDEQEQYRQGLGLLVELIPELADQIDVVNGKIEGGTDALRANIGQWKENALEQARTEQMAEYQEAYNAALKEQVANEFELKKAQLEKNNATEAYNKNQERQKQILQEMDEASENLFGYELTEKIDALNQEMTDLESESYDLYNQINDATDKETAYKEALEASESALGAAGDEMQAYQQIWDSVVAEQDAANSSAQETQDKLNGLGSEIENVNAEMQVLTEKYQDAYDAAKESVEGQYQAWEKAAEVVPVSIDTINTALESQQQYWENYNANLESLRSRTDDIEGLAEMLGSFADGSPDSVNAIAGMVDQSDEKLQEMVTNWQAVQAEHDETASSIAELQTNFSAEMDKLAENFGKSVEDMNFATEAASAARQTIQRYIDQADSMIPSVTAAYRRVRTAGENALNGGGGTTPGRPHNGNGFALGAESAPPGWAKVGEHGAELVYFGGGETIFTTEESRRMEAMRDGYTSVSFVPEMMQALAAMPVMASVPAESTGSTAPTVNVTFHVDGDVTDRTMDRLESFGDEFAERVLDVVRSAEIDADRRRY